MAVPRREYKGIEQTKSTLVSVLERFFKTPEIYAFVASRDFSNIKVVTEFPFDASSYPAITVGSESSTVNFIDIRATNYVGLITDPETNEELYERYGGVNEISFIVEVGCLSTIERQNLSDIVSAFFTFLFRDALNQIGIQVRNVSVTGTSEQPLDQEPNMAYFSSITVSTWCDWYADVPITETVERVNVLINQCLTGC